MKEEMCRAFCNEISVKEVPAGLAISTAFRRRDGDAISFYVIRDPALPRLSHLEDDGETIPYLMACGIDLDTQTRQRAFQELLVEYDAEFDGDESVIRTAQMSEASLPRAAIRFVALLLRLSDFLLLTQEHAESTFREDVAKRIKEALGDKAVIRENEPVTPRLKEVTPDMVLRAGDRVPVAVFFAQSAQRVNDAIFLQMAALYEARQAISVVALLEKEGQAKQNLRQRAMNRLSSLMVYDGDEDATIQRIEREVMGSDHSFLH
jgi:hypothetical protein